VIKKGLQPERPTPIVTDIEVYPFRKNSDPAEVIAALMNGHYVLITDFYSSGLIILSRLKKHIDQNNADQTFKNQRESRSIFRKLSHQILLEVENHKLMVKKAPEIGWFKILYPELNEFLLPFPQVQGLNSSWQWYKKGMTIPVLDTKIHPYFGTYFPTRFEHLQLFDKWLSSYEGEKESAFDIGVGCGVLTLQMLKHGFNQVYATDNNPNAIIGLDQEFLKKNLASKIDLFHGDLFADCNSKVELIVFNPPWIPASHNIEGLDHAIYYEEELFPRFFKEAQKHLKNNGSVVLLFSNLAEITNSSSTHPVKTELEKGGRFQKELFWTKKVKAASKKSRRDQNWRNEELVELWVLKSLK
jgi:hypothetical protein